MKKILFILIITLLTVSCEKTIEFNGEIMAPKLVVNSIISPDSNIWVEVTSSRFFLDKNMGTSYIENADLRLTVNGKDRGKLVKFPATGIYGTNYKVAPGDEVKIEVSASGYESVSGKAKMPKQPIILEVDTAITYSKNYDYYGWGLDDKSGFDTLGVYTGQNIRFSVKFRDKDINKNYYRLIVKKRVYSKKDTLQSGGLIDDREYVEYFLTHLDDIVFKEKDQVGELGGIFEEDGPSTGYSYNLFSDELLNGKEYNLKFTDVNALDYESRYDEYARQNPEKTVYLIYLWEVSSDYYFYVKSMVAAKKVDGNPFVEPVQVLSNIENGMGLLGSYTSSKPVVIEVKH